MTMVPMPMEMSEPPCVCANSAPARPTSPLEMAMPSSSMAPVFTPCARAMRAFEPVARMARPRSVAKNQSSSSLAATTDDGEDQRAGNVVLHAFGLQQHETAWGR